MKSYSEGIHDCLLVLEEELRNAKEELDLANKKSNDDLPSKNIDLLEEDIKVIKFLKNKIEQMRK